MIKKAVLASALGLLLIGCNRNYEKAIKSEDPVYILNTANQLYEEGEWQYAIELYQKVASTYAGTENAENIAYNSAMANFKDENYTLAAKQFKNFYLGFTTIAKAEEALFMSALSYYKGSPQYNLDQTNTFKALAELQGFINTYPNSSRVAEVNVMIDELQHKLERKYFEIAKSYYTTLKYKSAVVSFANYLDEYPDSSYREEAFLYWVRAKSQLALKSIFSKQANRIKEANTAIRLYRKAYPNSKDLKEVGRWEADLQKAEEEYKAQAERRDLAEERRNKNNKED